jgi:hypothetical protein
VVYLLSCEVVGRGLARNETDVPVGALLTRVEHIRYHIRGRHSRSPQRAGACTLISVVVCLISPINSQIRGGSVTVLQCSYEIDVRTKC